MNHIFKYALDYDFVVDLRRPSDTATTVTYQLADSTSGSASFDPMAYYTYVYREPTPQAPKIEDDLVAYYDDPGGDLP